MNRCFFTLPQLQYHTTVSQLASSVPLLFLLPLLAWAPVLTSINDGVWPGHVSQIKTFPPLKLLWSWCLTIVTKWKVELPLKCFYQVFGHHSGTVTNNLVFFFFFFVLYCLFVNKFIDLQSTGERLPPGKLVAPKYLYHYKLPQIKDDNPVEAATGRFLFVCFLHLMQCIFHYFIGVRLVSLSILIFVWSLFLFLWS